MHLDFDCLKRKWLVNLSLGWENVKGNSSALLGEGLCCFMGLVLWNPGAALAGAVQLELATVPRGAKLALELQAASFKWDVTGRSCGGKPLDINLAIQAPFHLC